jgi:hypothetical protein
MLVLKSSPILKQGALRKKSQLKKIIKHLCSPRQIMLSAIMPAREGWPVNYGQCPPFCLA